jgi:hypothetical protein
MNSGSYPVLSHETSSVEPLGSATEIELLVQLTKS